MAPQRREDPDPPSDKDDMQDSSVDHDKITVSSLFICLGIFGAVLFCLGKELPAEILCLGIAIVAAILKGK